MRAKASHSVDWGGCEELGEVFRGAVIRSHGGWWDMKLGVGGKSEQDQIEEDVWWKGDGGSDR